MVYARAEHADLVERRAESDEAVAADAAVGRLDADDAAEGGRLPHRAARLRTERRGHRAGGHQRRGSAGRAAGHARLVERMQHATVGRMLGGRAHRKLVAIRLARDQRPRRLELRDSGRLIRRAVSFENARAAGRGEFQRADVVFHGDRHAVQHAGRTRRGDLRVTRLAEDFGRSEQRLEALRFYQAVGDRFCVTPSNWPSFGTTKKPSLKAGANLSGPNASPDGVTSSARNRIASGPGTKTLTVPFAGTALSCAA